MFNSNFYKNIMAFNVGIITLPIYNMIFEDKYKRVNRELIHKIEQQNTIQRNRELRHQLNKLIETNRKIIDF